MLTQRLASLINGNLVPLNHSTIPYLAGTSTYYIHTNLDGLKMLCHGAQLCHRPTKHNDYQETATSFKIPDLD